MKRINQFEPWFGEEEIEELIKTVKSSWIIEHSRTRALEKIFADYVGAKYAVATTSGTMALALALMALRVGHGDEVIVPDFTFVATANAVKLTGATPVLADIKREDLTIDPSKIEKNMSDKTKAIIPVHFNGRPADMDRINQISKKHGLYVVEDCCQALGSRWKGRHLGTFSDIGCFSLTTTKIVTTGQGGMMVTDSSELYERMARLKDHGRAERVDLKPVEDYHPEIGFNFKLTDLQAAVGLAQFSKLDWRVNRIKEIYALYRKELREIESLTFLDMDLAENTPWYVDTMLNEANKHKELKDFLKERNIGTRLFYIPLHMQPCYKTDGDFANSIYVSERGLFLPSSTFLSDDDILRVCNEIKRFFGKGT